MSCSAAAVKPLDHGINGSFFFPYSWPKPKVKKKKEFKKSSNNKKVYGLYYPISPWQTASYLDIFFLKNTSKVKIFDTEPLLFKYSRSNILLTVN